jgi:hypothetical protein
MRHRNRRYLFHTFEVGEKRAYPRMVHEQNYAQARARVCQAACNFAHDHGVKFRTFKVDDNTVGVERIK